MALYSKLLSLLLVVVVVAPVEEDDVEAGMGLTVVRLLPEPTAAMLLRIGVAVNASSTKCPKIDDFMVIVEELMLLQLLQLLLFCGDDTIADGPPDICPDDKDKCEDDDGPGTTKSPVQGKSGKPGTPLTGVDAGVCIFAAAVVDNDDDAVAGKAFAVVGEL